MNVPNQIKILIAALQKFSGVGAKTAERMAYEMMSWTSEEKKKLSDAIIDLDKNVKRCEVCNILIETRPAIDSFKDCQPCSQLSYRDSKFLCIVSDPKDIVAIESSGEYRGFYHVLTGMISPLSGQYEDVVCMDAIKRRIQDQRVDEVILALDATLEGDATALYITEKLKQISVKISRLATGVPMGSSLSYLDGGTLAQALTYRNTL